MKRTVLHHIHVREGAKMTDFAGYEMPVVYTSIGEEHKAVREAAGIFDVSHMGEFIIKGKEALNLIQKISSNDASKLEIGQAQYSCMPNTKGGVVDDLIIYRLSEDLCAEGERAYMLVVNASNIEKDWHWIHENNSFDTRIINISEETALLAVQGPATAALLQQLTEINLTEIPYYHFRKGKFAGIENVLISATGYTGSGGFELYLDQAHAVELWDKIVEIGRGYGLALCGLGARDTLRLEMGYCLYGQDIDDETSPLEAGLGWITKLQKETYFNSKEIFESQKLNGIQNKLVGFKVNDRRVPRQGYEIVNDNGEVIGRVTSGTQSPMLNIPIGLGYVRTGYAKPGTQIFIRVRNKDLDAEVVKLPFVDVRPR